VITDALTRRGNPAMTSDKWHVVHSKWCGRGSNHPPFARAVVSEHRDRGAAVDAAKQLAAKLDPKLQSRPIPERDQIFVRPPRFRSLKFTSFRLKRRPR
jgi:hypothetical protein